MKVRLIVLFSFLLPFMLSVAAAEVKVEDPFDPNDYPFSEDQLIQDKDKSVEELLQEAEFLFIEERLLDGRTKLLLALQKDPNNYQVHSMLAGYYLVHVGHFKLALRYILRAQQLFEEQHGPPPYTDFLLKSTHAHHLHLLSQARLNLDDYQGALRALDEYESYGYYQSWYPGSRAWVLMKNERLEEAINVSRLGLLAGAEQGRTLNILGILLSMTGEREASLNVFKRAIAHEYALGTYGQPATPLNNSGEVYREIFQEEAAERSWMQATSLPDGCEHVLPALNLATVRMERLDLNGAASAIDNFESCVAQYPLRNGEEHRALVHLARGRIDVHSGRLESGIEHLRAALKRQQWFGKIGTDVEDLQAGTLGSLSYALIEKVRRQSVTPPDGSSYFGSAGTWLESLKLRAEAWWLSRRMVKLLIDKLNNGEDLYVRNTDSMLEYSFLGALLTRVPTTTLKRRLELEKKKDNRGPAVNYYEAWLGENLLSHGDREEGLRRLRDVKKRLRLPADGALKVHALLTIARSIDERSAEYRDLVEEAFFLNRASIPNYGVKLPVNFSSTEKLIPKKLVSSPFLVETSSQQEFLITHGTDGNEHSLRFSSRTGRASAATVKGGDFNEVLRKLSDEVFQTPQ
ncbi:MAG: hypothetical protein KDD70_05515 [Bdellovibrionales bacterium]|nr:hypothetical protein [Bdellovibrionales bacterium]